MNIKRLRRYLYLIYSKRFKVKQMHFFNLLIASIQQKDREVNNAIGLFYGQNQKIPIQRFLPEFYKTAGYIQKLGISTSAFLIFVTLKLNPHNSILSSLLP